MARVWSIARTDLRAMAPLATVAVVVMLIAAWLAGAWRAIGLITYVVASMGIGATMIGHEWHHATLGVLLTQPVSRRGILAGKGLAAAACLGGIGLVALVVLLPDVGGPYRTDIGLVAFVLAVALFVAPLLTMMTRSALAGTVLTLVAPFIVLVAIDWAGRAGDPAGVLAGLVAGAAVAAAIGAYGVWFFVNRFEDAEISTWQIDLGVRRRASRRRGPSRAATTRGRFLALAAKELRLQQLPVIVAALYVAVVVAATLQRPEASVDLIPMLTLLYSGVTALLIGAIASAAEREVGMLPWQTMLPMSQRAQFAVKTVVVFGLSLLLTVVVPGLVLVGFGGRGSVDDALAYAAAMAALTLAGLYVSTFSPTALRGLLFAIPFAMVAWVAGAGIVLVSAAVMHYALDEAARGLWILGGRRLGTLEGIRLTQSAAILLLSGLAVRVWHFALANHARPRERLQVPLQLAVVAAYLAAGTAVFVFLLSVLSGRGF
jgi:ABC-type transport system involved in multi-copper enzyme maturation permease subunit